MVVVHTYSINGGDALPVGGSCWVAPMLGALGVLVYLAFCALCVFDCSWFAFAALCGFSVLSTLIKLSKVVCRGLVGHPLSVGRIRGVGRDWLYPLGATRCPGCLPRRTACHSANMSLVCCDLSKSC